MATNERHHEPRHPIGVVVQRTGLTSHVIRAWERRYSVVEPHRSEGGHRLYSDAEVERLRLLHRLTRGGRQIGQLAGLPTEELAELLRQDGVVEARTGPRPEDDPDTGRQAEELGAAAWEAMKVFDADALGDALRRAALTLSVASFLDDFLLPLMDRVGEAWAHDELSPAHEHLASTVAGRVTGWLAGHFGSPATGPPLVVATLSGHRHELGALAAALVAASEGWRVRYLGPDLPASDIALAVRRTAARVVALSVVFPVDDPPTEVELRGLADALPPGTAVFVGGRASDRYAELLKELGFVRLDSFRSFRAALTALAREEAPVVE